MDQEIKTRKKEKHRARKLIGSITQYYTQQFRFSHKLYFVQQKDYVTDVLREYKNQNRIQYPFK